MRALYSILAVALLAAPAGAVNIEWVTIDAPGNRADDTGFGSVDVEYAISVYEVTNAQYAEFLNAVAASDPNGLYNEQMASSDAGGINRSGGSGSFVYVVKAGFASKPVNFVSFWDALRFANWLHNGQPTGGQDDMTTEDGAYTLTAQGIADNSIARNPGSGVFLTSEDEWYKAAYYDPGDGGADFYFEYPNSNFVATACGPPGDTPDTANCGNEVGGPTDVGAYTNSPGLWGTFDQGGNIYEWTEFRTLSGTRRGLRGGSFQFGQIVLRASVPADAGPTFEDVDIGFRVSSVPEPDLVLGCVTAAGALGAMARRRRASPARDRK